jgi:hypothetical protein
VIGALEDAEDYKAFEATITADYDAQSAVERELVLRLASLLWRLRRATTMETGLFELEADQLDRTTQSNSGSHEIVRALFGPSNPDSTARLASNEMAVQRRYGPAVLGASSEPAAALACCFLRVADLPNFAFDRLTRYEAALWRQIGQILFTLEALDRRKPQERRRRFAFPSRQDVSSHETD